MGNWDYAEMTAAAKKSGGPDMYAKTLTTYGFRKGVLVMLPVCIGGCVLTYKKGTQIVSYIKSKVKVAPKEVRNATEERKIESKREEKPLCIECFECGKKANGIDEITILFGYKMSKQKNIIPHTRCRTCRSKEMNVLWCNEI